MLYKASAPGSLMLLGEYAVLEGHAALVCALDKRISVTLSPRSDERICLSSEAFGAHDVLLSALAIHPPYQFVLATLKYFQSKIKTGCDIHIASDFSHEVGFGSSAAVTVATLAVLSAWLQIKLSLLEMIQIGKSIIHAIQKVGSGADVAGSVLGGVVHFRTAPLFAEKIPIIFPISVLYSGFKTKTPEAILHVKKYFQHTPDLYQTLCDAIGECASSGVNALKENNLEQFAHMMQIQQGLMSALQVNVPSLQKLIDALLNEPEVMAAKISGSGLGDCVVGLGQVTSSFHASSYIPATISEQGVRDE